MNFTKTLNNAMNTLKQFIVFTMIFSVVASTLFASTTASAAEKAPAPALPLPATGNVTLTLGEYDRLVDLANKAASCGR